MVVTSGAGILVDRCIAGGADVTVVVVAVPPPPATSMACTCFHEGAKS